jgi:steroid delta-isomerase-like uncharacterized protein
MEQPASNPVPSADTPSAAPSVATPSAAANTAEANKALVRRIYEEGLNRGNFAVLDELLDERLVDHSLFPGGGSGRDSFRRRFSLVRTAFPDATMTVEDGVAEGDRVVYRWRLRGTHTGPFAGIPSTGRHVEVTGMNMTRIRAGKVTEHWANFDHLGLLQQLGIMARGAGRGAAGGTG